MRYIKAFFMAWGMFLAVPCPYRKWDDSLRDAMLVCLPLIGLIVGGAWALAAYLLHLAQFPPEMQAAVMAAVPWLMTGFIHLDGYMDVSDAVLSRRGLEERQRILKDPHCGAFAVIALGLLILASFSIFFSWRFEGERLIVLALIPAATRASAGMAVIGLSPMSTSQYNTEHNKKMLIPLAVMLAAVLAAPIALFRLRGIAPLAAALVYWLAVLFGKKQLGGMNGDISGFALTLGELAGAFAIAAYWEELL